MHMRSPLLLLPNKQTLQDWCEYLQVPFQCSNSHIGLMPKQQQCDMLYALCRVVSCQQQRQMQVSF